MSEKDEARAILDAVRGGADVPQDVIDYALLMTGDILQFDGRLRTSGFVRVLR